MFPQNFDCNGEKWLVGDRIGDGGFGDVFRCTSSSGVNGAVKFIVLEDRSENELKQELFRNPKNIVPIWGIGETKEHCFLLMPLADMSLADRLNSPLSDEERIHILLDIVEALNSIGDEVVHRDLKPGNILLLEGKWCVSDFGLMKFKEESTRGHTLKHCFTPPYAAPEQWMGHSATPATDIYSLGVLAYELFANKLPFKGADLRVSHLTEAPEPLHEGPAWVRSIILSCLSKQPESRPSISSILNQLIAGQVKGNSAVDKLRNANLRVTELTSRMEAAKAEQTQRAIAREELYKSAESSLDFIMKEFTSQVRLSAPMAKILETDSLEIALGSAWCHIGAPVFIEFDNPVMRKNNIDVIAATAIQIIIAGVTTGYIGGAHSLWFCDAIERGKYRWYETAFYRENITNQAGAYMVPTALSPTNEDASRAIALEFGIQIDWQPLPFDQGDINQFIDRWTNWIADAVNGDLKYWIDHPDRNVGRWRDN